MSGRNRKRFIVREGKRESSDMGGSNLVAMVSKTLHFSREMTSDPSELIAMHTPETHKNKNSDKEKEHVLHSHTHTYTPSVCLHFS